MSTIKDKLRQITVGAKKDFKSKIKQYEGEEFEIREPSERQRSAIYDRANSQIKTGGEMQVKVDLAELAVWALICCTYVPGTDEPVFGPEDHDSLIEMPASQLDSLKKVALEYVNIDREKLEKVEKNSEKTTDDTTASN